MSKDNEVRTDREKPKLELEGANRVRTKQITYEGRAEDRKREDRE